MMDLNCSLCSVSFSFSQNLRRHVRKFHPDKIQKKIPESTSSSHKCVLCQLNFTRGTTLRRHIKKFHPGEYDAPITKDYKNFKCKKCDRGFSYMANLGQHQRVKHTKLSPMQFLHKCVFCEFQDKKRHYIVRHYEETHNIAVESEELLFMGRIQFENWKKEMEENTSTLFVKVCSFSEPKNGYEKQSFVCNRSGCYKSKGKGIRKLKIQGSLKINGVCPAEIDVQVYGDNKHIVQYTKTHCGHKNDYKDQYLTRHQRETIAMKIAANVPFRVILDEVRDSVTANTTLERTNRLARKDLYNIAKSFELENGTRVPVDGLDIEDWVKEMSEKDTVIYHKLKGSFCNIHIDLLEDDFVIIIMNHGQREILQKHASNCICIDRTHFLNAAKMELITLIALDDEKKGLPCAFFISNRIDAEMISLFYSCIKEKIGRMLETKIFMSDLEDIFYSSWLKIMGTPRFRLFCSWHVEKAWRDNLQKIISRRIQFAVYEDLKGLQQEEDSEVFASSLNGFLESWLKEDTLEFAIYFQENFKHNHDAWAQYYRVVNGLILSSDLKTVHGEVSRLFVFGKNNNRLNMAITAIMNYVASKLFENIARREKNQISLGVRLST